MLCLVAGLFLSYPEYERVNEDVFQRGVVQQIVTPESIVTNCTQVAAKQVAHYASSKREVLAFVTPWNAIGYNLTLDFGSKFTTIVPVWFQAVLRDDAYLIQGEQDIKKDWMKQMRARHPKTKIIPRVVFEIGLREFVRDHKRIVEVLKPQFANLTKHYEFDGVFLEFPPYFARIESLSVLANVVAQLRKALPGRAKLFGDVPSDEKFRYGGQMLNMVKQVIRELDFAFIAVYELPNEQSLSPSASLVRLHEWAEHLKATSKIIVGLPLFGFDVMSQGRRHVFGDDILTLLLTRKVRIVWIEALREHSIFFSDGKWQHAIYYPTLFFLKDRFDTCVQKKFAGFALWEIAQGMPCFFDIL
jgi:hypothetical protein